MGSIPIAGTMRDRQKYNSYMNEYMKERWNRRRSKSIALLGGQCVRCGSRDDLEFDHVDPSTKEFTIAKASSFSESRFQAEISKCQLLCSDCHKEKTVEDRSNAS